MRRVATVVLVLSVLAVGAVASSRRRDRLGVRDEAHDLGRLERP